MHLAETQRQAKGWEDFIVRKREGFRYALREVVDLGKVDVS